MTIGLAFLILFLPIIAIFIGQYFTTIIDLLYNAVNTLSVVPAVAGGLWAVLPVWFTSVVIAILTLTLSFALLKRFIG